MSKSIFSAPHFTDEAAAYAYVEARLWAKGRVCPHCGVVDQSGGTQRQVQPDRPVQVLRLPQAFYRQGWDHL